MLSLLGRIRSLSGGKPPGDLPQTRNFGAPEPDFFPSVPESAPAPRNAFEFSVNTSHATPSPPLPPDRRILDNPSQYITTEDVAIERPGPRKLAPNTRRYSFDSGSRNPSQRALSKSRQAILTTKSPLDPSRSSGSPLKPLNTNLSPSLSEFSSPPPVPSSTFGRRSQRPATAPLDTTPESSATPSRRGTTELSDSSGSRKRANRHSKQTSKRASVDSAVSPINCPGKSTTSTPQIGYSPASSPMSPDISRDQNLNSIQSSPTSTIASRRPTRTKSRRKYMFGSFLNRSRSHIVENTDTRSQTPRTFGYPTPPVPSESHGSYMFPTITSPTNSLPETENVGESSMSNTNAESRQTSADTDPISFRMPTLFDDRIETFPRRIRIGRQDTRGRRRPALSMPTDIGHSARRNNTWPRVHFVDDAHERSSEGGEVSRSKTSPDRPQQERRSEGGWSADHSSSEGGMRRGHDGCSPRFSSRALLSPALLAEEQPECEVTSGDVPGCACESPGADIGPSFSRRVAVSPSISGSPSPSSPEKHSDTLPTRPSAFQDAEADTHYARLARPLSDSRGWTAPQSFDHSGMSSATQNEQLDPDRPGSVAQSPGSPSRSLRPSGATSFSSATQYSARSQTSHNSSLLSATPTKQSSLGRHPSNAGARSRTEGPETPIGTPRRLSDKSKGKRKAEDVDITPRDAKKDAGHHTTFLIPNEGRSLRLSDSSRAPSSYHRKRARLSNSSPSPTPSRSRPSSAQVQNSSALPPQRYDSWSSRTSTQRGRIVPPSPRAPSRAASARSSQPPPSMATAPSTPRHHRTLSQVRQHERRQSLSQVSIPISALVSPHAPSISHSTRYHMHDPRKPPKKLQDTSWRLALRSEDDPGSPRHAWCFFVGFILFPLWWIAAFSPVPQTRTAGDSSVEKAVAIDDPQIEHDAKQWRLRCRIMSIVSIVTYIPFIILVAIFAPR